MIRWLLLVAVVVVFVYVLGHALDQQPDPYEVEVRVEDIRASWTPTLPATTSTTVRVIPSTTVPPRARTAPTGDVFRRLAMCETGGSMDQRAYNPAGPYYSYFQWSMDTWRAAGGTGHPFDASYEVQRVLAEAWEQKTSFASQWPRCSRVIGVA